MINNRELLLMEVQRLHSLGLSLIWIKEKDKRPVDMGWTKGPRKTYPDLEKSFKLGMNVGTRLGASAKIAEKKYLAVIDVDLKSNEPRHQKEAYEALYKILGAHFSQYAHVLSGRNNGSLHVYGYTESPVPKFHLERSPEKIKAFMGNSNPPSKADKEALSEKELNDGYRLRPAWEIDLMGEGAQVLLPPSIHPLTDKPYRWGRLLADEGDLISLAHIIKKDRVNSATKLSAAGKEKAVSINFTPEPVDLVTSELSEKFFKLIVTGAGIDDYRSDRTAAMMAACIMMIKCGFTENQILSVFTDKENFLGEVCYDHTHDHVNRDKNALWVKNYTYSKALKFIAEQTSFDDNVEFIPEEDLTLEEREKRELMMKEFIENNLTELSDWRSLLQRSENGNIKKTNFNFQIILKNSLEESGGELWLDQFYGTEYIKGRMPWNKDLEISTPTRILENDINRIIVWLSRNFKFEADENFIIRGLKVFGSLQPRHCIKDYIKSLEWDGKPRLDSWIKKYMKASDKAAYLSVVGRKLIMALIYRVFHPGCQFDQVIIFKGLQGVGKSSALRAIGGDWFTDNLGPVGDKDALLILHRHWLIEVAELDSMNKADADHFKQFVSSRIDEFRKPYGRVSEAYPRQCVLVGTTNREEFLKDDTGNRRFWPVDVGDVDVVALAGIRDQLFAEGYEAMINGEKLWDGVTEEFLKCLKEKHEQHFVYDDLADLVTPALAHLDAEKGFKMSELLGVMNPLGSVTQLSGNKATTNRIAAILRKMGFYNKLTRNASGNVERVWAKKVQHNVDVLPIEPTCVTGYVTTCVTDDWSFLD